MCKCVWERVHMHTSQKGMNWPSVCLLSVRLHSALQCVAVCCSVLQCVAVCCSVLQCVAVCCSVLQCVAVCCSVRSEWECMYFESERAYMRKRVCVSQNKKHWAYANRAPINYLHIHEHKQVPLCVIKYPSPPLAANPMYVCMYVCMHAFICVCTHVSLINK